MTPVVVLRPEPGCSATVEAARAQGLAAEGHPLSQIVPVAWDMPEGPFDGILAGSANAFRCCGPLVDNLVDLPVYAVGESTASAAAERGFRVALTGSGGLHAVLDELAGHSLRLLRLAGEDHMPLDPPDGIVPVTAVVYRAETLPVAPALAELLGEKPVVLLHSAGTAKHFAAEVDRLAIARSSIRLAALGGRIAAAAGPGWASVSSASEPSDPALLALARDLCHEPFPG
ncbi:uroporphyrinogen-III synthase [Altererythrobacter salegens]|uniref:Uroporphyrinogen-III synthase n=1 Tax=Croceibacterium salegens TaxID=1737568 RepID=A0A6I4SX62_9SPHN|nr:uroporphyrinogen-III synthase [Croceibacterium salegens]